MVVYYYGWYITKCVLEAQGFVKSQEVSMRRADALVCDYEKLYIHLTYCLNLT